MNTAKSIAMSGSIAKTAPKAMDSGMKSISIAKTVAVLPPFFAKYWSISINKIAPSRNEKTIGSNSNTSIPFGMRTNANADNIIPEPKDIRV